MPRTGSFGGFDFDAEVFTGLMQEADYWKTPVIASNVIRTDDSIMDLIGEKGNVATIPFYKPLNAREEGMEALNNDGLTNNVPVDVAGGKQTCMMIQRMKAFKAKDFTQELTGADPLGNIKKRVANYYLQVWEDELMNIARAVMGISGLSSHVLDLTAESSDANKVIGASTLIDAEQMALGDMAEGMGLLVMHSKIFASYKKMELVDYAKYVVGNVIQKEITLPNIGGKIVMVTDYNTTEVAGGATIYNTWLFGEGAFLSCDKKNYKNQYYADYDPETSAGTEKLYTKQGKVLHPNGVSLATDNIAHESPTFAELGTTANYALKYNHKNVRLGVIKSIG